MHKDSHRNCAIPHNPHKQKGFREIPAQGNSKYSTAKSCNPKTKSLSSKIKERDQANAQIRTHTLLFLAPLAAFAAPEPKIHGSDVFFGYSRTGNDTFYRGTGGLNGWEGALHIHFAPFLGGEADVSQYGFGSSSATPHTTNVMFGPRLTVRLLGIRPYAHVLVGVEHSANSSSATPVSETGLSYALGGGVDVPIVPFFAIRFAGDRISSTQSPAEGTKARFSTGLVFRF